MPELGELSLQTFRSHLGEQFRIRASPELALEARLAEAFRLGEPAYPDARVPFSLLFRAPAEPGILPQGTYSVEHGELGSIAIFLVPLQPDADGARYEAVFT